MQPHLVYLANSSGIKVGITSPDRLPIRWIDQGAVQAVPIFTTPSRRIAGLIESIYKSEISDRTQWQRMLMADDLHIDLANARTGIGDKVYDAIMALSTHEDLKFRDVSRPDDIEAPTPSDVTRLKDADIRPTTCALSLQIHLWNRAATTQHPGTVLTATHPNAHHWQLPLPWQGPAPLRTR